MVSRTYNSEKKTADNEVVYIAVVRVTDRDLFREVRHSIEYAINRYELADEERSEE